MMMRKAWCKSAQVILDHLSNGCELIVCIHQASVSRGDFHGYVWDPVAGKAVCPVRGTTVERLLRDGFVVEIQRTECPDPCYSALVRWGGTLCWKSVYRITREDEDAKMAAAHNREGETLFMLVLALRTHHEDLLHLPYRSRIAADLARLLSEASTVATDALVASKEAGDN